MEIVIRAALAPQEPSAQDSRVAAEARAAKAEAQTELRDEKHEEVAASEAGPSSANESAHSRAAEAYESAESLVFDVVEAALSVAA